jgi:RNA polymerase sigma-70 factor (ECF subfamily)
MPPGRGRSGEPDDAVTIPSEQADILVAAARDGDGDAFAQLYRATVPIVYRNMYGRTGDRAQAEDLVSDAYMRALRSIARFEGGSGDFVAWLLRIARNLFLDHIKSGRVRWEIAVEEMPTSAAPSDPEAEAIAAVQGTELRHALARLTADQQEVVYLRFLQGLPIADVAKIMGRAEGAIKALQFRALKTLERILTAEGLV